MRGWRELFVVAAVERADGDGWIARLAAAGGSRRQQAGVVGIAADRSFDGEDGEGTRS
jgi:hypothetical protein